jgi:hypothetical protein
VSRRDPNPLELFLILGMMQTAFVAWVGLQILLNSPFQKESPCKSSSTR